jgi:outer membrane receptor protein involved in Fe transport
MDDFNYRADNAPNLTQEAYGLWNAMLTYYPASESWDVAFGVDNINDKGYSTWKQDVGLGLGTNIARGMPRLMKLSFNAYF